jgi:hypothetical protein
MRHIADSTIIGFIALRVLNGAAMRKMTESVVIALCALSVLTACSTQSVKTVETEKRVQYATDNDQSRPEPVVTENRTTKTEETKTEGQSVGLLSGTVHVVGQAIALPFRVVAGLIGVAF